MYDYAKVYQSVCGYDFVLLDRTRCDAYVKSMREFADAELSQRLGAEGLRHLRVVTASRESLGLPLLSSRLSPESNRRCACSLSITHPAARRPHEAHSLLRARTGVPGPLGWQHAGHGEWNRMNQSWTIQVPSPRQNFV